MMSNGIGFRFFELLIHFLKLYEVRSKLSLLMYHRL